MKQEYFMYETCMRLVYQNVSNSIKSWHRERYYQIKTLKRTSILQQKNTLLGFHKSRKSNQNKFNVRAQKILAFVFWQPLNIANCYYCTMQCWEFRNMAKVEHQMSKYSIVMDDLILMSASLPCTCSLSNHIIYYLYLANDYHHLFSKLSMLLWDGL